MLLKKLVVSVSLASVTILAHAQFTNTENCDYFSGPHIGATAFYQSTGDKLSDKDGNVYGGQSGWGGGLFAGYGWVVDRTYLGAEIYGQTTAGEQKLYSDRSEDDVKSVKIKTPYTFGAMAKLGYLVTPQSLVYLGLGAENTKFKVTANGKDIADTNKWAFVPSIGMDLAINCNWQVGARFSYADYRTIDLADPNSGLPSDSNVKPRRADFGLNVTYHFA